jgi:hypothetical protein
VWIISALKTATGWQSSLCVVVVVQGNRNLTEIIAAFETLSVRANAEYRRYCQADQRRDNGHNN